MHRLTVLALPDVVAFDLSTPAQVFGNEPGRYDFTTCADPRPGGSHHDGLRDRRPARPRCGRGGGHRARPRGAPGAVAAAGGGPRCAAGGPRPRRARRPRSAPAPSSSPHAGLLDGRRATTHWAHAEQLAERYPAVTVDPGVLYVDEGDVLTSAGVAAGIDLCLHLVRRDHGAEVANAAARRIVVAPHRDGGQAQFVDTPLPARGRARARAHARMGAGAPARAAHGGGDGAPRRVQRAHLRAALPRRDGHHPAAVAAAAARPARAPAAGGHRPPGRGRRRGTRGFGTATSLRSHFRRATATTPIAYRRSFRGSPA